MTIRARGGSSGMSDGAASTCFVRNNKRFVIVFTQLVCHEPGQAIRSSSGCPRADDGYRLRRVMSCTGNVGSWLRAILGWQPVKKSAPAVNRPKRLYCWKAIGVVCLGLMNAATLAGNGGRVEYWLKRISPAEWDSPLIYGMLFRNSSAR